MQKATLRKTGKLFTALIAVLVSAIAVQVAAAGELQQGDDSEFHQGNPKCTEFEPVYEFGFKPKFDGAEAPSVGGPYTLSDGTLEVTITVGGDSEAKFFDWSSNIGVDAVIVKGGNGALVYTYDPPAEATSDTDLKTPFNDGGNRAAISHIEFCYDTEGGDLEIKKTAETRSIIRHEWKIEKTVDRKEIALVKEPTGKAIYTVSVTRDEGTETDWQVWGDITVTNGTDTTAKITSVTDQLSDHAGEVDVFCDAPSFPLELEPGQTLTCSYGPIDLPDGADRENVATVTTAEDGKVGGASDSVPVTFGDPEPLNTTILVRDDFATPDFDEDDYVWEFKGTDSVTYERTYWCKDAGKHTNTAWIVDEIESIDNELETGPQDDLNNAVQVQRRSAQVTVAVFCDTKKGGEPAMDKIDPPTQPLRDSSTNQLSLASTETTDLSCLGADSVRGSRGASAWGLIGRKALKTRFFLSKRSYWKVLKLKNQARNPYYRLAAAYTMTKLHRLGGTASTPAVEKSMSWTLRYLETHRPGYSKLRPGASPARKRIVKRLHRVMRKHTRVLQRYAAAMDGARCTS
ncbi:MAG: hypothetical protein ACR2OD_04680 [Gaiellaceae bacterium]